MSANILFWTEKRSNVSCCLLLNDNHELAEALEWVKLEDDGNTMYNAMHQIIHLAYAKLLTEELPELVSCCVGKFQSTLSCVSQLG